MFGRHPFALSLPINFAFRSIGAPPAGKRWPSVLALERGVIRAFADGSLEIGGGRVLE